MRKVTPASLFTLVLILLVALGNVIFTAPASAGPDDARVRIIHASPDAPNVDIFANGNRLFSNLAYKQVSDYVLVPAGAYNIEVRAAGSVTGTALLSRSVTFLRGLDYSVATIDRASQLKLFVIEDRPGALPTVGNAKIRLIQTAVNSGPVDIFARETGTNLFTNTAFYNFTQYVPIAAGNFTFEVRPTGTVSASTTVTRTLAERTFNTIIVFGVAGGTPPLEALVVTDALMTTPTTTTTATAAAPSTATSVATAAATSTPAGTTPTVAATSTQVATTPTAGATGTPGGTTTPAATGSRFRIVNAAPDSPNLTIVANNTPLLINAPYKTATAYAPIGAATYNIQVFSSSSPTGTALLSRSVVIVNNFNYTLVVLGRSGNLQLLVLEDRVSPDRPGNTQIRFVQAVVDSPKLDLFVRESNTLLFSNFGFNNFTNYTFIPEGTASLEARPNASTTAIASARVTLAEFSEYTVIAVGVANGSPGPELIVLDDSSGSALPGSGVPAATATPTAAATPTVSAATPTTVAATPTTAPATPTAVAATPTAAAATATPAGTGTTPTGAQARLAVLHASPDGAGVDIYLGSQRTVSNLTFRQISAYRLLAPGAYNVSVVGAGVNPSSGQPLLSSNITLEAGKFYLIVIYDNVANVKGQLLEADLSAPAAGNAKVRFANYSTRARSGLRVELASGDAVSLAIGEQSVYTQVPGGAFTFSYGTGSTTGNSSTITLAAGDTYLIVALDNADSFGFFGINEKDTLLDVR